MPFREGFEKYSQNVIPDVLDNIPYRNELPALEMPIDPSTEAKRDLVLNKLLSHEQREQLRVGVNGLKKSNSYEHLELAGDKNRGTSHPHLFTIEQDNNGLHFYFVDPEHNVGKQGLLRPKIGNLVAMRIPHDDTLPPEVSILRFSTEGLAPDDLKLKAQLQAARELLTNAGVPAILEDTRKNILFRIAALESKVTVQARYTNQGKAQNFLEGGKGSRALRGKVDAQQAIVNKFIHLLQEGQFKASNRFGSEKHEAPVELAAAA